VFLEILVKKLVKLLKIGASHTLHTVLNKSLIAFFQVTRRATQDNIPGIRTSALGEGSHMVKMEAIAISIVSPPGSITFYGATCAI